MYLRTCTYIHVLTHMHLHTCSYTHVLTHMYLHTCTYTHVLTNMYLHTCTYAHVLTHMYLHTHTYTYVLTHVLTHMQTTLPNINVRRLNVCVMSTGEQHVPRQSRRKRRSTPHSRDRQRSGPAAPRDVRVRGSISTDSDVSDDSLTSPPAIKRRYGARCST